MLTKADCKAIYDVCHVIPIHSGGAFGLIAGAVLKDPSSTAGRKIVHQYDPGKNRDLTVWTVSDPLGLYVMNCPRPPCAQGALSY